MGKGIWIGTRHRLARSEYLECALLQAEPAGIWAVEVGITGERGMW